MGFCSPAGGLSRWEKAAIFAGFPQLLMCDATAFAVGRFALPLSPVLLCCEANAAQGPWLPHILLMEARQSFRPILL